MRRILSIVLMALAAITVLLAACATKVFVLREMSYFGGEMRNDRISVHKTLEECQEAAINSQLPNDPDALTIGTDIFYCDEEERR